MALNHDSLLLKLSGYERGDRKEKSFLKKGAIVN
ncbi:hypothetical protein NUACC26_054670 [Scytonema sp. NUACC26]